VTRSPGIAHSGFILLLVFAISVGIGWGTHSLDHLLSTGLLQDDQVEVASEQVLLTSCESTTNASTQGCSTFAVIPLLSSASPPPLESHRPDTNSLVLPPTPFSERSHRPG